MSATRFYCIMCGAQQTAPANRTERFVECPACRHVVPVPVSVLSEMADGPLAAAYPHGVLALELKFLCDSCGKKLRIDARWEGRAIKCPLCEGRTEIPRWSQRRERTPDLFLSADEMAFLTSDGEAGVSAQPR